MIQPQAPVDLTTCDREPIHVPGTIQSTGVLLALDATDWRITHASINCAELLSLPHAQLIGQTLSDALGREVAHRMTNALTTSLAPTLPGRAFAIEVGKGRLFNAAIHTYDGRILVEFEPATASRDDALPLLLVRTMLTRMQQADSTLGVCEAAVDQLCTLIGFDRVMVYQFLHDGSGTVIAEKRREEVESFFGHHYPASDIPLQARALSEELDKDDCRRRCAAGADPARDTSIGATARPELQPASQRVADPSRVPAQHGRRRIDVDFHRDRR